MKAVRHKLKTRKEIKRLYLPLSCTIFSVINCWWSISTSSLSCSTFGLISFAKSSKLKSSSSLSISNLWRKFSISIWRAEILSNRSRIWSISFWKSEFSVFVEHCNETLPLQYLWQNVRSSVMSLNWDKGLLWRHVHYEWILVLL